MPQPDSPAPALCADCGAVGTTSRPISPTTRAHGGCDPLRAHTEWLYRGLSATTRDRRTGRTRPNQAARDNAAALILAARQIPDTALPDWARAQQSDLEGDQT